MPKISEERRAERREQILVAALALVAAEGFHRTTMADVIAASGLSAGAVYGYFKSKDDLIVALADRAIGNIEPLLLGLVEREPPPDLPQAIGEMTALVERISGDGPDLTRVAVAAWAEAVRNPAVHEKVHARMMRLRGHFVELARRLQADGRLDPGADPVAVGQAAFGAIPGFLLQRLIVGDVASGAYAAGLAALAGAPARAPAGR